MTARALFLTRADATRGFGHLGRTSALINFLQSKRGFHVLTWLLGDETALSRCRELSQQVVFFPSWELKWAVRRKLLAKLAEEHYPAEKPQLVVFDGYDFSDTYWGRSLFRKLFPRAVFFGLDVYRHRARSYRPERRAYQPVGLQWVVNSLHAPFGGHQSEEGGTRIFFGTDYLILPAEVADSPCWKPTTARHVAMHLSGRNVRRMHRLLSSLAETDYGGYSFRVFTQHPELLSQYASLRLSITELAPQGEFLHTFSRSAFGITSAGMSLYELAHLGVPLIVVPAASDEFGRAEQFAKAGCGELVTTHGRGFKSRLFGAIERMRDAEVRADYSERGRKLIDGRGLERVADLMVEAVKDAPASQAQ